MFSLDSSNNFKISINISTKTALWLGAALVASVTLVDLALWWNRYFGPTLDGYFAFYGHLLLAGKIPYRDFYLHVPPLVVLESAALEAWFGPGLIVPRIFGALERVAIAGLGYFWLARLFSVRSAALATLAMIIAGSGGDVEVLFLYNHHSVLWALAAGLLASHALERQNRVPWLELLAGSCAGMAFLTKQTVGLGVFLALPVALWLASPRAASLGDRLRRLGVLLAGWCLPVAVVAAWLARHDALAPALDQLFIHGPSSKGSIPQVLARAVLGAWEVPSLRVPAVLALAALAALAVLIGRRMFEAPVEQNTRGLLPVAVLSTAALLAGVAAAGWLSFGSGFLRLPQRLAVFLSLYGCFALSVFWGLTALRRGLARREGQLLLFSFIAFATGYMFSTSWPSFEPIAIPGFGLVVGLALTGAAHRPLERLVRGGVWAGIAVTLCFCTWLRLEIPFDFAGWVEPPVRTARETPTLPGLAGFQLAPSTIELVETATQLLREHTEPGEAVFVYPHLPVLYLLAEREPPTFAMIHWFDVCSDDVAAADAEILRSNPPAMVVDFRLGDADYALHEQAFRSGRPSGQRRMREVLRELENRYQLVATLPAGGSTVSFWVRPDDP